MEDEMLVEFSPGDLVLLRQRRAGGLRLPAQGPYTFVRYRTSKRLTAEVENPLTGRLVSASVSHLIPYAGRAPVPRPPPDEEGLRKRVRIFSYDTTAACVTIALGALSYLRPWWVHVGLERVVALQSGLDASVAARRAGQVPWSMTCETCHCQHIDLSEVAVHGLR